MCDPFNYNIIKIQLVNVCTQQYYLHTGCCVLRKVYSISDALNKERRQET